MSVQLLVGDAVAMLNTLPAESVHCCVTSPPYWGLRNYGTTPQIWDGQADCPHIWEGEERHEEREATISGKTRTSERFYGGDESRRFDGNHQKHTSFVTCPRCGAWRGELGAEPTPKMFVEHLVGIFRAVKRVLRADGTLWLNMGDCYASAWPCQRRNEVGLGSLPDGTRASRPSRLPGGLKEKDLVGIPWMVAFALRADGWYLRSDIIWAKGNPMPASVTDRPTTSHEYLFLLTKQPRYYYDATAIREKAVKGAAGSLFHTGKTGVNGQGRVSERPRIDRPTRNKRSVWTINTAASGIPHYATFPAALVRPCVLAGTSEKGCCAACGAPWERQRECLGSWRDDASVAEQLYAVGSGNRTVRSSNGGMSQSEYRTSGWAPTCKCEPAPPVPCTVLDPFGGVGTSAAVAHLLGRNAISIDLDPASLTHYPTRLAALSKLAKPKRVPQEQRTLPAMEEAP